MQSSRCIRLTGALGWGRSVFPAKKTTGISVVAYQSGETNNTDLILQLLLQLLFGFKKNSASSFRLYGHVFIYFCICIWIDRSGTDKNHFLIFGNRTGKCTEPGRVESLFALRVREEWQSQSPHCLCKNPCKVPYCYQRALVGMDRCLPLPASLIFLLG